ERAGKAGPGRVHAGAHRQPQGRRGAQPAAISRSQVTEAGPMAHSPSAQAPHAKAGGGVSQWKRQVTVFAMLMIVLVIGVAGASGALMWHMLRDVAAAELDSNAKIRAAVTARQAILEVDRLLLKTIALSDPDAVRAAAVASIGAASRLEDAVTTLREVLPDSADVAEMARLVDSVKAPRMKVVVAARKHEDAQAMELLAGIAEPLKRIDDLSAAIQAGQADERARRGVERQAAFQKMLLGLLGASAGGVCLGLLFYWRLMKRLSRTDEVERLLGEVHQSAQQLDSDGRQL